MKLDVPFVQLPLLFNAAALAQEIEALGELPWRPHPQGFPGNSMLPLVAVHGDAANEAFAGPMQPTPELQRCPYLGQVLRALGVTIGRTRLMRLSGHAEVTRHADQGYYWVERVRVHVPIVTQPTVRFECGDAAVNMAAGECWIFDTWRQHRVLNDAEAPRIHLVCDTVGGARFWQLVARGRAVGSGVDGTLQATLVEPDAGASDVPFEMEAFNVPKVMSPWELRAHLLFLIGEALPHPALPALQEKSLEFVREWRALWARSGDSDDAVADYRKAFERFATEMRVLARGVVLKNELPLFQVLMIMIGKSATATTGPVQPEAM